MFRIRIFGSDALKVARSIYHEPKQIFSPIRTYNKIDLLILTQNANPPYPACNILLLPDELTIVPPCSIVISYGMSSKSSVTLSSIGKRSILSVQRELITLKGNIIEPQEIPITNPLSLSQYPLMASSAALLLMGIPPEKLS